MNLRAILPRRTLPPLWREAGIVADGLTVLGDVELPATHAWPSAPREVLVVPGFLAGDSSMRLLSRFLERGGYEVVKSGLARNVDCSEATLSGLEALLTQRATPDSRVAIIGHSRGGLLARVLARRHPALVAGIVMLGSPVRDQLAVHPLLWAELAGIALMGSSGTPGLLTLECAAGPCCQRYREDLSGDEPLAVPAVSVYSRNDGLVDWNSCIDPSATAIEVTATHIGMIAQAATFRVVLDALRQFAFTPPARCAAKVPIPLRSGCTEARELAVAA